MNAGIASQPTELTSQTPSAKAMKLFALVNGTKQQPQHPPAFSSMHLADRALDELMLATREAQILER